MRMAKDGAKNRAQAAVDMLADFGSDPALMHLNDLAERCKAVVVRNRAASPSALNARVLAAPANSPRNN